MSTYTNSELSEDTGICLPRSRPLSPRLPTIGEEFYLEGTSIVCTMTMIRSSLSDCSVFICCFNSSFLLLAIDVKEN